MDLLEKMKTAFDELEDDDSYADKYEMVLREIDRLVRIAFSFGWERGERSVTEKTQQ